ncbi:hypothetical protein DdX_18689 [Ditylenchus destructor]|uniref:DUF4440 domain-containing protein n=1 Tax=Ditylenchus destructor TaxID=166010 RepID=A0AAD4MPJ6_9BILA|nr:hypothetical protein DdX_18689 [Ditylenchus destructor]
MPLSQKEVDSLIHGLDEAFKKAFLAQDAKAITEMYHPQATFVMTGVKCAYGREAILKAYQEWLASKPAPFQDDEKKPYEHVYKKAADGKYLFYHDEFAP